MKAAMYRVLFRNGLAYRSPRWYSLAEYLSGRIDFLQLLSETTNIFI